MERSEEPLLRLASSLIAAGDRAELLRHFAAGVMTITGADGAVAWTYDRKRKRGAVETTLPEGAFAPRVKRAGRLPDLLADAVARKAPLLKTAREIDAAALEHLSPAGAAPVSEILCVPFTLEADLVGILELVRTRPRPAEEQPGLIRLASSCAALASSAAAAMVAQRAGREHQLAAINRLMQLYDVSQVFHGTLEIDDLVPAIANRLGLIFETPEVRIWLAVEGGDALERAFPGEGEGPARLAAGEGTAGRVFQSGEGLLVTGDNAEEPEADAAETGAEAPDAPALPPGGSLITAPLIVDEATVGVIEVIRSAEQPPFGADDRDYLEEIARQAAVAIRNARLLQAERKARDLGALLDISREITSTLDLDRVLMTIVNRAGDLAPSDRSAILLSDGGPPELRAVSGNLEVNRKDPQIRALEELLTWAHAGGQGLYVSEADGAIETEREETREKLRRHFAASGMKTFVAFPLKDEEGHLGVLSVESDQPYSVSEAQLEALNILVSQATVAIRNASLYRRIPLIGMMQPLAGWRARLRAIPRWKWVRGAGATAVLAALLAVVPCPLRIAGEVLVLPARNSAVTAEVEGIVETVHRREGDPVRAGDLLATLVPRDYRIRVEQARAHLEIAERDVAGYEAGLDGSAARQARIRRDGLREEFALLRQELDKTRILAPVAGVVLTPRLEQKVGTFLERGDAFCQIADMSSVAVEVMVPEADAGEIRLDQAMRLKIRSFPTRTFEGRVEIVPRQVVERDGGRYLVVRGRLLGSDLPLKSGMLGRAKIDAGRRSLGVIVFRRPARFVWRHVWTWIP